MAENDEDQWIFDCLVYFLNGPVWNAPLQSFIEEKSLIFEYETSASNEEEYKKIFEDYKNLVDFMLGSFMEDIGITPEQFEEACNKGTREAVQLQFDQNLFEQIWAANDYEIFKRFMTERNVELQLQALDLIERKCGIIPESLIPHKTKSDAEKEEEHNTDSAQTKNSEKKIMQEVIKQFSAEHVQSEDNEIKHILEEKAVLQQKLKSVNEEKKSVEKTSDANHKEKQSVELRSHDSLKDCGLKSVADDLKKDLPQSSFSTKTKDAVTAETSAAGKERKVDSMDLKKRQEYLKMQRDKLVALKKEARKKQLNSEIKSIDKANVRPKSAKAAEMALEGSTATTTHQLQIRKALAERLKSEVINKTT